MKYQIWFQDKWPLCQPTNREVATDYGKRLARAYGKGMIKLRKYHG